MTKRLLDHAPDSGLFTEFAYDESENRYHINNAQDVEPIIEANKIAANNATRSIKDEMRRVASIPLGVFPHLEKLGIVKGFSVLDPKAFKRWLNDPENRFFRTNDEVV